MAIYDNKLIIGDKTSTPTSGSLQNEIVIPIIAGVSESVNRWQGISRALNGSFGVSDFGVTNRELSFSLYACQYSDLTAVLDFFKGSNVNYSQYFVYGSIPEDQDSNQIFGLNATQYTFTDYSGRNFQKWRLQGSGFEFASETLGDIIQIRFNFWIQP